MCISQKQQQTLYCSELFFSLHIYILLLCSLTSHLCNILFLFIQFDLIIQLQFLFDCISECVLFVASVHFCTISDSDIFFSNNINIIIKEKKERTKKMNDQIEEIKKKKLFLTKKCKALFFKCIAADALPLHTCSLHWLVHIICRHI